MRRLFLSSITFGLAFFGSFEAQAAEGSEAPATMKPILTQLAGEELTMVDLIAGDFFEHSLRHAQSSRIEAATAEIYRGLSDAEKIEFREKRRAIWRSLTEEQRLALRGSKTPSYLALTEEQKLPFRNIAVDRLTGVVPAEHQTVTASKHDKEI